MLIVEIPLKTESILNLREAWCKRAARAKKQRRCAKEMMPPRKPEYPVAVTLIRISPRPLDDDNLRGALKSVRDGVADWLGVDDRDPRVAWCYAQRKGEPKVHAVEVEVRAAPAHLAPARAFAEAA